MGKKLSIELAIRLQEQLAELVETYGVENVKDTLNRFPGGNEDLSVSKSNQPVANQPNYSQQAGPQGQINKINLPPNVRSVEEFEATILDFAAKGKIVPEVAEGIKGFIFNAKLVMSGQYKKVDESFITNLTSKGDLIKTITPEEDWIKYNGKIIRTKLKRKLRLVGYDFLDSEVEVGKLYNEQRHNCVGKEQITNPALDKRVLKVMSEGLIIGRKLHINANVVIGVYTPDN